MDKKELNNIASMTVDVLQGDYQLNKERLSHIDMDKVNIALKFILENPNLSEKQKLELIDNSWRINFRSRPISPEEFLSPKYLGSMAESVYPRVRKWFLEFFDETKPYRNLILYPFIGAGKSTLVVLINLYLTLLVSFMIAPKRYFGLAPSANLAFVLGSFSLKKAQEILQDSFTNILDNSNFFEKVRTHEKMVEMEREYQNSTEITKLYWTTASKNAVSSMLFSNSINYKLCSNSNSLLGLSIVCGTLTEINFPFFSTNPDYGFRFYNDLKTRVWSRMKGNFFGRVLLDNSPNMRDNMIDSYIVGGDAEKDPTNYIVSGSHWKWVPEDYVDINNTFPVFMGGSGKPPRILTTSEGYDASEILQVPEELRNRFQEDLIKSLKDLGGIPQGSSDKLFQEYDKIDDCFVDEFKTINYCIKADARMNPEGLIWDQVKDVLYVKNMNRYKFWYKPNLPRVFHIDQSVAKDVTAIAFCHVERKAKRMIGNTLDLAKDLIYVIDQVIPIHPMGGRINLTAIRAYVEASVSKGCIPVVCGSYDTYQSEAAIQELERFGIEMQNTSVDKSLDPYMFLVQLIELGNLKIGKNIMFKNNLKSLQIVKRESSDTLKVDHTYGETVEVTSTCSYNDSSLVGLHAKDVSDAVCGAVYLAREKLAINPQCLKEVWEETNLVQTPEMIFESTKSFLKDHGFDL